MELRQYFAIVRHWLWLLILGAILGGAAAFLVSIRQMPIYAATAKEMVLPPNKDQWNEFAYLSGQQLVQTYVQLLFSEPVFEATEQVLGYEIDPDQVKAEIIRDTLIIKITVEDPDPERAAAMANTLLEVLVEQSEALQAKRFEASEESLRLQITDIERQIGSLRAKISARPGGVPDDQLQITLAQYQQIYSTLLNSYETVRLTRIASTPNLVPIERASIPSLPIRPQPVRNAALGGGVGLLLALGIAFLIEYLDDTIKTTEEVKQMLELPVIGYIGPIPGGGSNGVHVTEHPRSPIAECFRSLRTNLEFADAAKPLKSILITSPEPKEGKTTVAVNLAAVIAQGGKRVVLLDADFRRPTIHRTLGIKNRLGLSDFFRSQVGIHEISQISEKGGNIITIPTGSLPPNPAELLSSDKMSQLLAQVTGLADVVVIDSPPTWVTDPIVLASQVDGVVLVMQPGQTRIGAALAAVEQLERAKARIIGVVFNNLSRGRGRYYQPYSPYYYSSKYYSRGYGGSGDGGQPGDKQGKTVSIPEKREV